jgi:hypothetical protein
MQVLALTIAIYLSSTLYAFVYLLKQQAEVVGLRLLLRVLLSWFLTMPAGAIPCHWHRLPEGNTFHRVYLFSQYHQKSEYRFFDFKVEEGIKSIDDSR